MPRRQRSAYGCIERMGRDLYRIRWMGDARDGRGRRRLSKTIRGTRADARLFLSKMQVDHHADQPVPTVGEVFERYWWPETEARVTENTRRTYLSAWKRVGERWGTVPVSDVRPLAVQEWISSQTLAQAKIALRVLSPVMEMAARYEMVDQNPMKTRFIMPSDAPRRDAGIYDLAALRDISGLVRGCAIEAAFLLSAFGSCRPGEALGTRPEDVEAVTAGNGAVCAAVAIRRQVDAGGRVSDRLKTEQSARWAVVPPPWSGRLIELAGDGRGWMTEHPKGGPMGRSMLNHNWARASKRLGFEYHPFQNLRNSWLTMMQWEMGVHPEICEKLMGHKGQTVTDQHYNRPQMMQLVNAVADAFSKGVAV